MINQPNRKQVEVHCRSKREIAADVVTGKAVSRDTPSILQDERFFGKKTTQVDFRSAITEDVYTVIDGGSGNHRQLLNKVSGIAHTEPFDIHPAIGVDRLWTNFFSRRDV